MSCVIVHLYVKHPSKRVYNMGSHVSTVQPCGINFLKVSAKCLFIPDQITSLKCLCFICR